MNRLYTWNFLIAFLAQTAFTVTNSMMAHYARWVEFLGGDVLDVGSISSVSALFGLLCRPLLAPWIDKLGPRICWVTAGVAVMAAGMANLWVEEIGPLLYVLRSIMAVGIAVVFASGLTYIAHVTPVDRRAEAIGVLGAGGFAGLLIGPVVGDFYLSGETRTSTDFFYYFLTMAVAVAVSIFFVLVSKREPIHADRGQSGHPFHFLRVVWQYWSTGVMGVTLAFGSCMTVPFVFLAQCADQWPGAELGHFFIVYASVGLAVRMGLRSWPDQFGPTRILVVGMLTFAVGMWSFLLVSVDQPRWILLSGAILGLAHGITFHSMVTLVLEPFPPQHRGAGSTLALIGLDSGMFLGSQIFRFVISIWGYDALFHSVGICCIASIVGLLVSVGLRPSRRTSVPVVASPTSYVEPAGEPMDAVS